MNTHNPDPKLPPESCLHQWVIWTGTVLIWTGVLSTHTTSTYPKRQVMKHRPMLQGAICFAPGIGGGLVQKHKDAAKL